jgi:hypothetical protein
MRNFECANILGVFVFRPEPSFSFVAWFGGFRRFGGRICTSEDSLKFTLLLHDIPFGKSGLKVSLVVEY